MTKHIKYSRKNAPTLKQKMPLNKGILFNISQFKQTDFISEPSAKICVLARQTRRGARKRIYSTCAHRGRRITTPVRKLSSISASQSAANYIYILCNLSITLYKLFNFTNSMHHCCVITTTEFTANLRQ